MIDRICIDGEEREVSRMSHRVLTVGCLFDDDIP